MIVVQALINLILALCLSGAPKPNAGPQDVQPPLKLRIGDTVKVITTVKIAPDAGAVDATHPDPYQGDFTIQSDGAIYGIGFGRLIIQDKTVADAQVLVRKAMAKFIQPSLVFVTLKDRHQQAVYVVGKTGQHSGIIPFLGSLTLRQSLADLSVTDDVDLLEVQVFRSGKTIAKKNFQALLRADDATDIALQADDVIAVNPLPILRIWVTGSVKNPGRIQLPEGTKLSEAVASAGGPVSPAGAEELRSNKDFTVVLQRGATTMKFSTENTALGDWPILEAGDTVLVQPPAHTRVVIGGEVLRPGEVLLKPNATILELLAEGGGLTKEGTAANVLVFRGRDWFTVDARIAKAESNKAPFELQNGDLVLVRKSLRFFYAFGDVVHQGEIFMPDDKPLYAIGALGLAGGLGPNGTLRRMFISRPDKDGKAITFEVNLDEYIKDGKKSANPEILPGDAILFSKSRDTTLTIAGQLLSSFVLLSATSTLRL